jgi:predicted nucleotidyltransferase
MRLSDFEREIVRAAVARRLGPRSRALLFGSRVDDNRRGGDIDLLVDIPDAPDDPFTAALQLENEAMRGL